MHLAARNSHAEVVIYLLNKGADGTIPTKSVSYTCPASPARHNRLALNMCYLSTDGPHTTSLCLPVWQHRDCSSIAADGAVYALERGMADNAVAVG